jgi:hypothetical protein
MHARFRFLKTKGVDFKVKDRITKWSIRGSHRLPVEIIKVRVMHGILCLQMKGEKQSRGGGSIRLHSQQ